VLSTARSGSTLLRFILDAHPDLACPGETDLGRTCEGLATLSGVLDGVSAHGSATVITRTAQANETIRSMVETFEGRHLERTGKIRWCDKSLGNVEHADLLSQLWPEATFVCLVRHCMDVVYSAVEAGRWGISGYGLRDHVLRHPGNSVAAVAEYWYQRTAQILDFSRRMPARCHLLRYEDLVLSAEEEAQDLLRRLVVAPAPGITSWCFDVGHEASGPGDAKIWLTSDVHARSLGRGRSVPLTAIPGPLLARIDALLDELGYFPVGDDWAVAGSVLPRHRPQAAAAARRDDLRASDHLLAWWPPEVSPPVLLETWRRWPQLAGATVGVRLADAPGEPCVGWRLGERGQVVEGRPPGDYDYLLTGPPACWEAVLAGRASLAEACLSGELWGYRPRGGTWVVLPDEVYAIACLLQLETATPKPSPLAAAAAASRRG
jgi:hypothetical protein